MNWQTKTREMLEKRHVSVDALGRAIGEKGRSLRNWLRPKRPTKALNEVAVTQAIADYFGVDVLWLTDDAAGFPPRPRPAGMPLDAAGQVAAFKPFMSREIVRVLEACQDPQILAFVMATLDALPAQRPAAPPTTQTSSGLRTPSTKSKAST